MALLGPLPPITKLIRNQEETVRYVICASGCIKSTNLWDGYYIPRHGIVQNHLEALQKREQETRNEAGVLFLLLLPTQIESAG